jgi:AraC-like DNA-binding protein
MLLVTTDESIIDIAGMSGFNNISNFNRAFKTYFDMTPSTYRKTQKNNTKSMLLTKITILYPFCYNNTNSITNQEYFRITIIAH